jgi:hypothetical protein
MEPAAERRGSIIILAYRHTKSHSFHHISKVLNCFR